MTPTYANSTYITSNLTGLLPASDLFNLLTLSGPCAKRVQPHPFWDALVKSLMQFKPDKLFQYVAFNVTTINTEVYNQLSGRVFRCHPTRINDIVNSTVREGSCLEHAMQGRNGRTIARILKAGSLCPFMIPENYSVRRELNRNGISVAHSFEVNTSRRFRGLSPVFLGMQNRIATHMEAFVKGDWSGLGVFIERGYIQVTLSGTSLTAFSIAVQQDNPQACAKLVVNGARLGDQNDLDSPPAYLFSGHLNSGSRETTRQAVLGGLDMSLTTSNHLYQYFIFCVQSNNCAEVERIGKFKDFDLTWFPKALGDPLGQAIRSCSPTMVDIICSLPGSNHRQRNGEGLSFLEVVIKPARKEFDLIERNISSAKPDNIEKLIVISQILLNAGARFSPQSMIQLCTYFHRDHISKLMHLKASQLKQFKTAWFEFYCLQLTNPEAALKSTTSDQFLCERSSSVFPSIRKNELAELRRFLTHNSGFPIQFIERCAMLDPDVYVHALKELINTLPSHPHGHPFWNSYGFIGDKSNVSILAKILVERIVSSNTYIKRSDKQFFLGALPGLSQTLLFARGRESVQALLEMIQE